ncbi:DNA mismatch repair protein MutS [Candidatus Parcubacteria bacterium]|nr:MAG: DNA mismatch repair protein MutS [Candidatus Parcubacteria bacterium]
MTFHSILFNKNSIQKETTEQPPFFTDLNLDQVVEAITARKQTYNLKPFFFTPLHDVEIIRYRHEVMQDMEDETLMAHIKAFARQMEVVRRYLGLAQNLDDHYHKKGWFLEAARLYCDAVASLLQNLNQANLTSRGLLAFRDYLASYAHSSEFQSLLTEATAVKDGLASVKYSLIIQSGRFSVRRYEDEADYTVEIEKTFEKFKQSAVKSYLAKLPESTGMSHIEAKILEFVARLYPEQFAALDHFCTAHNQFVDETLRAFDREIQFYVAYLDFIAPIKRKGLTFCYPQVSETGDGIYAYDAFDLALARTLLNSNKPVVCNDFYLEGPERVLVVSGPNQGGKTTFARMFGQLHYLASLGCPVPGRKARLFLFDQIFTHFERAEDIRNLRGKLQDDLVRIHDILARATPHSIIILNEIFASTTLEDAVFLSKQIMTRVLALDVPCVWVTFIDELSRLSEKTVSMVSTITPENPAIRTFKIIRKPADGLAYALSIAEKHRLTYEQIKERIQA